MRIVRRIRFLIGTYGVRFRIDSETRLPTDCCTTEVVMIDYFPVVGI